MIDDNSILISELIDDNDFIYDTIKTQGFSEFTIKKSCGSQKGDGYVGIITTLDVHGIDYENKPKTLHLIVKSASTNEALRKAIPVESMYRREIYAYETVFPTFALLEQHNGVIPSSLTPHFFKGYLKNNCEALILENLKTKGYCLYNKNTSMDECHLKLVMREYGRLHALSLALRDQNKPVFHKTTSPIDDFLIKFYVESDFKQIYIEKCVKAKYVLNQNTEADILRIYENFLSTIEDFFVELLKFEDRYSVLLHGDCWPNNMMFKYENKTQPDTPTGVRFLDFQLMRLGSPVLDLSYFFYSCSSKELVDKLDEYLQIYYNSLSAHLERLGSDPQKVFPYSVLKEHWKKYARYGLIYATLVIYVLHAESDQTVGYSEIIESGKAISGTFSYDLADFTEYNDRMRHLILHFVTNKFI